MFTDEQFDKWLADQAERDEKADRRFAEVTEQRQAPGSLWQRYAMPIIASLAAVFALSSTVWAFAGDHIVTTRSRGDETRAMAEGCKGHDTVQDRAIRHGSAVQNTIYTGVKNIGKKVGAEVPDLPQIEILPESDGQP